VALILNELFKHRNIWEVAALFQVCYSPILIIDRASEVFALTRYEKFAFIGCHFGSGGHSFQAIFAKLGTRIP